MAEPLPVQDFLSADGSHDWVITCDGACAFFATEGFEAAASLATEVVALLGDDEVDSGVDLRVGGVTVRMVTSVPDHYGLTERHRELAGQISAVARLHGATADRSRAQGLLLTIDALDIATLLPFWRAVLGYVDRPDTEEDAYDPQLRLPPLWFQQMEAPRPQRNRIHLDLWIAPEQVESRLAAALAAGGRLVSDAHAPSWWTLADPEGNEVDVATVSGRAG